MIYTRILALFVIRDLFRSVCTVLLCCLSPCENRSPKPPCRGTGVTESLAVSTTARRASSPISARATSSGRTLKPSETAVFSAPSHSSCPSSTFGHACLFEARSVSRRGSKARVSRTCCACGVAVSAVSYKKRRKSTLPEGKEWPANSQTLFILLALYILK